jgi:hypothetical protein
LRNVSESCSFQHIHCHSCLASSRNSNSYEKKKKNANFIVTQWTKSTVKSPPDVDPFAGFFGLRPTTASTFCAIDNVLCIVGKKQGVVDKILSESLWTPLDRGNPGIELTNNKTLLPWITGSTEAQMMLEMISNFLESRHEESSTSYKNRILRQTGFGVRHEIRPIDKELLAVLLPFISEWETRGYTNDPMLGSDSNDSTYVHGPNLPRPRQINAATLEFFDYVSSFKRHCERGGQMGFLQNGHPVRLPRQARVGDIVAAFHTRTEMCSFILRPDDQGLDAEKEMAVREYMKENAGYLTAEGRFPDLQLCKLVTFTSETRLETADAQHSELPFVIFALH